MTPSIWTGMYAELPLPEALRKLCACGWRSFEVSTEHLVAIERSSAPQSLIEDATACVQEYGLSTSQAHALLQANVADADAAAREADVQRLLRHIEIAASLGVKHVVMHPGGYAPQLEKPKEGVISLNVTAFRRLGDAAAEHGIRICLENMPFAGAATAEEMLYILREISHAALGIVLDTSHANMCALDIGGMISQFGDLLLATHISDNNGAGDQHLTPGGGTVDWVYVADALRKNNYEGNINLEIPGERHRNLHIRKMKASYAFEVAEWLVGLVDQNRL